MIAAFVLYAIGVGCLFASAAWTAERGAALLGVSRRWIWVAALAAMTAAPLAAAMRPEPLGGEGFAGTVGQVGWDAGALEMASATARRGVSELVTAARPAEDWMFSAWISLSVLLAGIYAAGAWQVMRRRRCWKEVRLGGHRVLITDGTGPAVFGLLRPVILLPPWVLDLAPDDRSMVLEHEYQHVRARDTVLVYFAVCVAIGMPWNPAAWYMAHRLRRAVEVDCDARVLAASGATAERTSAYAELLLLVASRHRTADRLLTPALIESSSLSERIVAMFPVAVRLRRVRVLCAVGASTGLIAVACSAPPPVSPGQEPEATVATVAASEPVAPAATEPAPVASASPDVSAAPPPVPRATSAAAQRTRPSVPTSNRAPEPTGEQLETGPRDPVILVDRKPVYTAEALREKIQGTVELEIVIGADGKVGDARVVRSLDAGLDEEALKAARQWEFQPATDSTGRPVAKIGTMVLEFRVH